MPAQTSTMISTSTGASSGSTGTPTAERACTPASPKTLPSSSETPLATCGWPVKSGVEATKHDDLDDPLDQREVADLGLDGGDGVQRALLRAVDRLLEADLAADLAGGHQLAGAHRQLAGGEDVVAGAHGGHVDRHRLGDLGHRQPELGQPLLGVLIASAAA